MVGISGLFSGNTFAQALAQTGKQAARPAMELQINQLQNAVIDRMNKKIEEVTADFSLENDTFDAYLDSSRQKLERFVNQSQKYLFDNGRNMLTVDGLVTKLNELDTALQADNTTAFDATLKEINWMVGMMHDSQGFIVGLYVDDGVKQMQVDGLVSYDNAGVTTPATSRSDFADDAAASAAITAALETTTRIAQVLSYNQEAGENLRETTQKNLNSTIFQIEATRIANETDKANEVEKLRREYSQLLNSVALAYESNVALTERISAALFEPPELQPGSIMSMFT